MQRPWGGMCLKYVWHNKKEWLEHSEQREAGKKGSQRGDRGGYSIQGFGGQCRTLTFIPSEMEAMEGSEQRMMESL